jgi:hypothetical protein
MVREFRCSNFVPFENGSSRIVISPQTTTSTIDVVQNTAATILVPTKIVAAVFSAASTRTAKQIQPISKTTITQQQQQHSATAAHNNIYTQGQQQQHHLTTAAYNIISAKHNSTIHNDTGRCLPSILSRKM